MYLRQKDPRLLRKLRLKNKVKGKLSRPRISVFRSLNHIYAQIIDDDSGKTIVSISTLDKNLKTKIEKVKKSEAAKLVGKQLAELAVAKGIKSVVFDRSGYLYHGRVKALADGAREGGLEF